jgi:DNA processing protein
MEERDYRILLSMVDGVGPVTFRHVIEQLGEEEATLEELFSGGFDRLKLPERVAQGIGSLRKDLDRFSETLRRLEEREVTVIIESEERYPERLTETLGKNAPPVLYVYGRTDLLHERTGAVVGTRSPDPLGVELAKQAASALVGMGRTVVSGCAKGVDSIAHNEAIEGGGNTVGVLPQGILTLPGSSFSGVDPSSYLLLSEFPPTQVWTAGCAMARNKTICALADFLVVIQAAEEGGTLHSGSSALKMGKTVFVMTPPKEAGAEWEGNRKLVKKGAIPVEIDDETGRADWSRLSEAKTVSRSDEEPTQGKLF